MTMLIIATDSTTTAAVNNTLRVSALVNTSWVPNPLWEIPSRLRTSLLPFSTKSRTHSTASAASR